MKRALRNGLIVVFITALCPLLSEAKKKEKLPPDPRFAAIQNISVLPVVDARAGKKAGVNMEKLQGGVVRTLKKKHYSVGAASSSGEVGEIAVEDIEGADPKYLKKLGPSGERWVMVVFLDDVASKITFGSTGNAELRGFLFDKDTGDLIWKDRGVGQAGQGGLMGMTMKGMMKGAALDAAVSSLLASVPKRPK